MNFTPKTTGEAAEYSLFLTGEIDKLKASIPTLEFGSEAYDKAAADYLSAKAKLVAIPELLKTIKLSENKVAIDTAAATVGNALSELLKGLKVEELLGSPVTSLRYAISQASKNDKGEEVPGTIYVIFNPVTTVAKTGPKKDKAPASDAKDSTEKKSRVKVSNADGSQVISRGAFVKQFATAEEFAKVAQYPHVLIDSKNKFDAFLTSHPQAAGWKLTD